LTVRLAHLTDIHFGGENRPATEAAIDEVMAFSPHLVVITGDLTLNGKPREFAAARAWLARLPLPVMVTPGNHDTPYLNLILRALTPFDRYRRYIGDPEQARFDGPGLSVRAINSARGAQPRLDWSKGALDLEQVGRAADELAASPEALKVFACHHPLIDMAGMPVTGGVHRGQAAAARLAESRIDLILTGHVHNPFALALESGPAPSYAIGAGTLSQRTRGTPVGFNLIEADEATVNVTALAWNGAAFETFRAWPLPRG
jgi:3',5'-cyclic AMP phosphodiesterase CpdA